MIIINKTNAKSVNLGGRGGKEALLGKVFEGCIREDEELYDATQNGLRLEFKKQADTQWFDAGKYHNLSDEDRSIEMVFILIYQNNKSNRTAGLVGKIEKIFTITLGSFLDTLTSTKEYQKFGWEWSNIETCAAQKKKYPSQQAKVKVELRKFLKKNSAICTTVWSR